jgi:3-oxoacyl-[acyl-carrier-protein] synthase II
MENKRIVVTGIGLRSPIGNNIKDLQDSLLAKKSGVIAMPEWEDIQNLRTNVAGVCSNINEESIARKHRRSMGRVGILAALAAQDAISDSSLSEEEIASERCGISFGSTEGSAQAMEKFLTQILDKRSLKGLPSSIYLQFMSHTCAANIASMFEVKGPVIASCTACVSGSQGIGYAYDAIKSGRADIMIAGGAEEMHFMDAGIFDIMRATSTKFNDNPDLTPKPFDAERDGLVVGEGSGCLILEDYEHAKKRNAIIHSELIGYGTNCDGTHLTNPSSDGMTRAMNLALKDARISSEKISHVNAHATATDAGDIAESKATYNIFSDKVPVTGFKGYMGHTLGACGAIESIITILMMNNSFIAPTRNLKTPDERCSPIQHVMGDARDLTFDIGMNNNFAFGGINTSLIFKKI